MEDTITKIKEILKANVYTHKIIYLIKYRFIAFIIFYANIIKNKLAIYFKIRDNDIINMEKLKDAHKGKRCIIIGNGPSLRLDDLEKIKTINIDSFGSNKIVDLFNQTSWRPNYLGVMDPDFLISAQNTHSVDSYINILENNNIANAFFTKKLKKYVKKQSNKIIFLNSSSAPLFTTKIQDFSEDVPYYVSDLGTVTGFSIQIAIYMGYEKIYLYGLDNTYRKQINNNGEVVVNNDITNYAFGIIEKNDKNLISKNHLTKFEAFHLGGFSDVRKMNIGYKKCKEYADKHGVKIYNATRGGKLEVFERVDFDSLFKD